eukprot:487655_1
MLYFIGLGLGNENDITLRGLNALKSCSRVFLEAYTSILACPKEKLEDAYGCSITLADREMVESNSDAIIGSAVSENVAFLVVGDPFAATTHVDLLLRAAKEKGIETRIIHNASIMNAVACCGLQLYNFGQTVSIPFFEENWRPDSFYEKIAQNRKIGLHTLCLLDIKVKEQSIENLMKGLKIFEPPRYMTVNQCIEQLLEVSDKKADKKDLAYDRDTKCVGLARVGQDDQQIEVGTMEDLLSMDFGDPLHCFVIPGTTHCTEDEILSFMRINRVRKDNIRL